ncbi:dihydrofolate reductase family protein [Candidatus Uhrbacteria bacterium]|nr:dihydrofolate reductase family protein [Candidatus Uhrbacteria bacterium]
MKPRCIALVVGSIDGRVSLTARSRPVWASAEDQKFFRTMLARADAVVVGRNTYAASKGLLRGKSVYLFSRRGRSPSRHSGLTRMTEPIVINPKQANLRAMLKKHRQVCILGGAMVYQTMLDAGLIDDLYVTIEPLIFGHGKPMFDGGKQTKQFRLLSARRLNKDGALLLRYAVRRL